MYGILNGNLHYNSKESTCNINLLHVKSRLNSISVEEFTQSLAQKGRFNAQIPKFESPDDILPANKLLHITKGQ